MKSFLAAACLLCALCATAVEIQFDSVVMISGSATSTSGTVYTSGTGFFIDKNYIVTNYHVVKDYRVISLMSYNGKVWPGTVVGIDRLNDIAVIHSVIDGKPVEFDSTEVAIGLPVYTIGNPENIPFLYSLGNVASKPRILPEYRSVFYFIAEVNVGPGSSGSPVFRKDNNQVLGVVTAIHDGLPGYGYILPVFELKESLSLITASDNGTAERPYLGIKITPLLHHRITHGVIVTAVRQLGSTQNIYVNDIIQNINGRRIGSGIDFIDTVSKLVIGESVTIQILRFENNQWQSVDVQVTVGKIS